MTNLWTAKRPPYKKQGRSLFTKSIDFDLEGDENKSHLERIRIFGKDEEELETLALKIMNALNEEHTP